MPRMRTKAAAAGGPSAENVTPVLSPEVEAGRVLTVGERQAIANARLLKKRQPAANEIRAARFNRHLQKFLSMKGAAPAPLLSKEIAAHFLLEDGAAADQRFLQSWETFGTGQNIGAGLGFNSGGQLRNPVGSNLIAVVEKSTFGVNAGVNIEWSVGAQTADLPVLDVTAGFDGRTRQFGANIIASHNPVGSGVAGLGVVGIFGTTPTPFVFDLILNENQEFPLLPGFAVQVRCLTPNTAINLSWKWRERFLEDSERK
jgi:hypothetical protein